MKILVVDDNRLLATILADHLIERGHQAVATFDGRLAEIFCDRDAYDLVVMDMVLPERDGMEVLERLREKQHRFGALVITGFPELREKESERLARLDVTAVLEKPFSFADVDTLIERACA